MYNSYTSASEECVYVRHLCPWHAAKTSELVLQQTHSAPFAIKESSGNPSYPLLWHCTAALLCVKVDLFLFVVIVIYWDGYCNFVLMKEMYVSCNSSGRHNCILVFHLSKRRSRSSYICIYIRGIRLTPLAERLTKVPWGLYQGINSNTGWPGPGHRMP